MYIYMCVFILPDYEILEYIVIYYIYIYIYSIIHTICLWLGPFASSWEVPGRRAGVQGRNGRYLGTPLGVRGRWFQYLDFSGENPLKTVSQCPNPMVCSQLT